MFSAATLQTLIDVGFVSLVTLSCFYALSETSGSKRKTDTWKRELSEVEGILRNLISDATAASRSLDRHLSRRQEELTTLVQKLETLQGSSERAATPFTVEEDELSGLDDLELLDVPNPTWLSRGTPATSPADTATAGISTAPEKPKPQLPGASRRTLKDQIEVTKNASSQPEEEEVDLVAKQIETGAVGDVRLTNPDPITYKVALRLLRAGKEIHVVARKLALPLQEVRLLDRLIRATNERNGKVANAMEINTDFSDEHTEESNSTIDALVEREITLV